MITRPVRPFSPHDPLGLMPKQFPLGFLVAVLLTASGLLWAVMFFGPLAHLSRLSGGMTPFDIRPWGYSYAEARAFLEAIGAEGRAYYASPELILDAFYPPLYAVSRGLALWWLTMPGRIGKAPVPLKVRWALIAVPILMATLDVVENACVAVMLWTWPDPVERCRRTVQLRHSGEDHSWSANGNVDGWACDSLAGAFVRETLGLTPFRTLELSQRSARVTEAPPAAPSLPSDRACRTPQ